MIIEIPELATTEDTLISLSEALEAIKSIMADMAFDSEVQESIYDALEAVDDAIDSINDAIDTIEEQELDLDQL